VSTLTTFHIQQTFRKHYICISKPWKMFRRVCTCTTVNTIENVYPRHLLKNTVRERLAVLSYADIWEALTLDHVGDFVHVSHKPKP
jgi:hypothetical protein